MSEGSENNIIEHNNALAINTKLEQYIIKAILGAGGFGITYLADDTNLDKQVVLKEFLPEEIAIRKDNITILPKTSKDHDNFVYGIERFQEEAKTLAKFNHPNIVRVLNFFRANGTAYLVMDFEEGEDLQEYISSIGRDLTQKEILDIIMPILDGLREVHAHNFLHRDIKLSNIFIRKNSSPMLIDFGAARNAIGQKSKTITQILTPGYAPVEQYSTDISKQGAFTDIYATGAVLYKMATGRLPKEAQDRSNALIDGEIDPYISIKQKRQITIDENFAYAVDWALKIRAKDRPQSVRELQNALEGKNKPEVESEIEPQKTETTQKEAKIPKKPNSIKEEKKQKSRLMPILGGIGITIAVSVIGINYYNDIQESKREAEALMIKEQKEAEAKKIIEERKALQIALEQKAKKEFGESIDKGSYIKPALVKIKAGSFTMRSDSGDSDEKPTHKVTIDYDFAIGKYEVTNQEFVKFLNDVSEVESKWIETRSQDEDSHIIKSDLNYRVESGYEKHPVIEVSWFGAKAYTKWLSQKTGEKYRLLTEAEWEYVAKAGTDTKWSFGDNKSDLKNYAWYDENSYDLGKSHKDYGTHQVGTKKANPWDVYDMHGNVWEWCEDWYVDSYNNTPKDGNANTTKDKNKKVLRGGSWYNMPYSTRSAIRDGYFPTDRDDDIGFRLQRTLP